MQLAVYIFMVSIPSNFLSSNPSFILFYSSYRFNLCILLHYPATCFTSIFFSQYPLPGVFHAFFLSVTYLIAQKSENASKHLTFSFHICFFNCFSAIYLATIFGFHAEIIPFSIITTIPTIFISSGFQSKDLIRELKKWVDFQYPSWEFYCYAA